MRNVKDENTKVQARKVKDENTKVEVRNVKDKNTKGPPGQVSEERENFSLSPLNQGAAGS